MPQPRAAAPKWDIETLLKTQEIGPSDLAIAHAVKEVFDEVKERDPHQEEFQQAVEEVLNTMAPVFKKHPEYVPIMKRMVEPERVIMFRVPWVDDKGEAHVQRAFRVQFNSALGPYKGGLRFHPTVNLSIIKFLGFEQVMKNALTTLPLGGGKGGSDFDPKGKSNQEIMRFCQAFMTELCKHIGPETDVPAGDVGVGPEVIGYLFGQYKKVRNEWTGILTGKPLTFGGSNMRPEATGYGLVYFVQHILESRLEDGDGLKGKKVAVSGAGNVAQYAVEKLLEYGAVPVTMSDSGGTIYEPDGFTIEALHQVMQIKGGRGKLSDYKSPNNGSYKEGEKPWQLKDHDKIDIALPCATQNEVDENDVAALKKIGCRVVAEGANMPSSSEAISAMHDAKIEFGPGKAANAGGVAVSGLEMSQNSMGLQWTREEVDQKLQDIMKSIYKACEDSANEYDTTLQAGANIAGFIKVAQAMEAQGVV